MNEDAKERFKRLMPRSQDLTLLILKGHLLLEEQLQLFLDSIVRTSRPLEEARLTFHQRYCIFLALSGVNSRDPYWRFIEGTNRLRNKIAHCAEIPDFHKEIDKLLTLVAEEGFVDCSSPRERASRLRESFGLICGMLHGFTRGFTASMSIAEDTGRAT